MTSFADQHTDVLMRAAAGGLVTIDVNTFQIFIDGVEANDSANALVWDLIVEGFLRKPPIHVPSCHRLRISPTDLGTRYVDGLYQGASR